MSNPGKVLAKIEDRIGWLIFSNPEKYNAVSLAMWEEAARVLEDFAAAKNIRAVILAGAGGKAFVSGADISRFGSERSGREAVAHYNAVTEKVYAAVHDFPKPTIALIPGYCIGGGLGLAVSCDMRIASETARFALPAAKLGLGYDFPGIQRFVDLLGPSFTKEIFFTARHFDAEEARMMGLVNRVLPDAEAEDYTRSYAAMIAENAPLTVDAVKFTVGEALKPADSRDLGRCVRLVDTCFSSNDYTEGRKAFMEKRKPVFTGE